MRQLLFLAIVCAVLGIVALAVETQNPQQTAPTADPYANNAAPGATQFPLAAPAGKDSNARIAAPARGVAAELGPLANTQAKPEVGPFAASKP